MPCTLPVEKTVVCETFASATDMYRGIGRIRDQRVTCMCDRGVTYQMADGLQVSASSKTFMIALNSTPLYRGVNPSRYEFCCKIKKMVGTIQIYHQLCQN